MPFKSRWFGLAALSLALMGCKSEVLAPAGPIATQQRDLLISSTLLMLVIILPVMVLIVWFGWAFRAGNKGAVYRPNWDHSTKLELVIWAAPLFIIISLGALTWVGTHMTDPYRPLAEDGKGQSLEGVEPLKVQVVALDWKWLFILPEQGVASVNELTVPIGRPVEFQLTSDTVMNAFYIPAMAGMIYAMPGMQTELNGLFDHEGTFQGLASHYSGAGFSKMRFKVYAEDQAGFEAWVTKARAEAPLDRPTYLELAKKSEGDAPRQFGQVERGLFARAVNLCVEEGKMCQAEMMALDMKGGTGVATPLILAGDRPFVTGACTTEELEAATLPQLTALPVMPPLRGHGLALPGMAPDVAALPQSQSDL